MCPFEPELVAFVAHGDIFVVHTRSNQQEVQLTFTSTDRHLQTAAVTAGYPSYITQEEFNRFQGFWWNPARQGKKKS